MILLEDRLEERQAQSRFDVESHRLGGHVLARSAQHVGVEQLVRDQGPRPVIVLGPPGRRDSITQLRLEAGPLE